MTLMALLAIHHDINHGPSNKSPSINVDNYTKTWPTENGSSDNKFGQFFLPVYIKRLSIEEVVKELNYSLDIDGTTMIYGEKSDIECERQM